MILSMIAAVGKNGELGKNNRLLWHLEGDLPFFKKITMGKPVIMGRKTFESLPGALPGRANIVLTRDKDYSAPGIVTAATVPDALALCGDVPEAFVIGGAAVYALFLPLADALYLTEAQATDPAADVYFPDFDKTAYKRAVLGCGGGDILYQHVLYTKKPKESDYD